MRQLPNTTHLKRRVRRVCHERPNALAAIRDGKLYKADHATFEDYCKVRWGMTPQHAGYAISTAEVAMRIEETSSTGPANAHQARPLAKLPPAEQAEAWEEVVAESEQTGEKIPKKHGRALTCAKRHCIIVSSGWHNTATTHKGIGLCSTSRQILAGTSGRYASRG